MTVLSPRSAAEAVRSLAENAGALPLAGGTDLMVVWNLGLLNGKVVVDLSRVGEWKKISVAKNAVRIGSLVTHSEIQRHAVIRARFPLLVQACSVVGAAQIQNRGTLGGNIANASPAGDTFPPLAVYEAVVHCVGPDGKRVLPIDMFFAGVKKTNLKPGELIEAIELPVPATAPSRAAFRKVGTRAAQSISKTMFAGLLWLKKDGTVADARLSFGSLAPTVKRLRSAERLLAGRRLDAATAAAAAAVLTDDVSPIDDIRSTRDYRLEVSRNLLVQFLEGRKR